MKHRLKNIANRPIPLEGTDVIPEPGEVAEVEMNDRNRYLVKNKFYEDLGEVELKESTPPKEEATELFSEKLRKAEEEDKKAEEEEHSYTDRKKKKRSKRSNIKKSLTREEDD